MKSLSWIFWGCDANARAEIAAGLYDSPGIRKAYLDAMAELFLEDALAELPTSSAVN